MEQPHRKTLYSQLGWDSLDTMSFWTIHSFASLPSTQDHMRELLQNGEVQHGLVIRAAEQRAGRGQRARDWHSPSGGSYQTVALRMAQTPPAITIAIALGISEVLAEAKVDAQVKWVNDIYLEHKKLAGILCEHVQGFLLVGVGLNVIRPETEQAIGLPHWRLEQGHQAVLDGIRRGLDLSQAPEQLALRFALRDFLAGRCLQVETPRGAYRGYGGGIDAQGCLQLHYHGDVHSICQGRVLHWSAPASEAPEQIPRSD